MAICYSDCHCIATEPSLPLLVKSETKSKKKSTQVSDIDGCWPYEEVTPRFPHPRPVLVYLWVVLVSSLSFFIVAVTDHFFITMEHIFSDSLTPSTRSFEQLFSLALARFALKPLRMHRPISWFRDNGACNRFSKMHVNISHACPHFFF